MVVHAYNLSPWEVEAGELRVQGQPELQGKFDAILDYLVRLSQGGQTKKQISSL
jgi:hypothetical protein